ncbi:hypothetical protein PVAND_000783 [Polypedilum vanderplanki]|uniref:FYVE-type domain-containing protein n=1 Tax=Polypedilum vanderplanki TaxID=319348 RepID=A0A9J6BL84_POLVA|nr:hypothetical protein PVAND_000783 [Polypedilum vanderplanki]
MSNCNTCSKPFGFFNRELGCVKCNRVFCKKCLCYKLPDALNPKKTILVCLRCFKLANDSSLANDKTKPKVEELLELKPEESVPIEENVLLQPMTTTNNENKNRLDTSIKPDNHKKEISNEEDNLDDIHRRLANLKGVDYKPEPANKILFSTDTRSEQEKIDDLLTQFFEEKNIDAQSSTNDIKSGTVDDIERRLAALRGQDIDKLKTQIDQDAPEETEQEEIDRTLLQYVEEAKLPDFTLDTDEKEFLNSIPKNDDKKSIEELPFCEICNEDAVLRCLECENLFCHSCFLEFHDEEDYKTHKTKPYQAPNN